ncbi:MAG: helix-turn-helix domain-containing protein [Cetobacterium sp.]
MNLPELVRHFRTVENISQSEMAQMMECAQNTVSLIERGLRKMPLAMLESLEEVITKEWKIKFREAFINQLPEYENIFSGMSTKLMDLAESDLEFINKLIDTLRLKKIITGIA